MIHPINIHHTNQQVELVEGMYHIDFVGGWIIYPQNFKILLKRNNSEDLIEIKRAKWPVQSYEFGTKCKRYYTFKIDKSGLHNLNFENSKNVDIKWLNVPIWSFIFPKLIDNSKIMIYIHRA